MLSLCMALWDIENASKKIALSFKDPKFETVGNKAFNSFIQHMVAGWLLSVGTVWAGGTSREWSCWARAAWEWKEASLDMSHTEWCQDPGEKSRAGGRFWMQGNRRRMGKCLCATGRKWEGSLESAWCCAFKATENHKRLVGRGCIYF